MSATRWLADERWKTNSRVHSLMNCPAATGCAWTDITTQSRRAQ